MNYKTGANVTNLIKLLRNNKGVPITATKIAKKMKLKEGGNQVLIRGLISYAILNGHLIKSSPASPRGFWLSDDKIEIRDCIKSLRKRAEKIKSKAKKLKELWNHKHPKNRLR